MRSTRGESLVELILAIAIFAVVLPVLLFAIGTVNQTQPRSSVYFQASLLTQEAKNIIHKLKNDSWQNVMIDGDFELVKNESGDNWALLPLRQGEEPREGGDGLRRRINLSTARRSNGAIAQDGQLDPATKLVTVAITWDNAPRPIVSEFLITRSDKSAIVSLTSTDDFTPGVFDGTRIVQDGEDGALTVADRPSRKPPGLVSWWRMSGEYASVDSELDAVAESQNNAQLFGDPLFAPARYGAAMELDGVQQYARVAANTLTDVGLFGNISIEVIFEPDRNTDMPIIAWHGGVLGGVGGVVLSYTGSDKSVRVNLVDRSGTNHVVQTPGDVILANQLNHVVVTYSKNENRLVVYRDGVVAHEANPGQFELLTTEDIFIGRDSEGRVLSGRVDEVAIYDRAVTADEVWNMTHAIYESGAVESSVPRYYHSLRAKIFQPQDTRVYFQVALTNPQTGFSCETAPYYFVGPQGTRHDYFTTSGENSEIFSPIPIVAESTLFENPALCAKVRIFLFSRTIPNTANSPLVRSVDMMYLE